MGKKMLFWFRQSYSLRTVKKWWMIRQVIREELQNTHFVSGDPVQAEVDEIPAQMLDFLSAMEDGM